MMHWNNRNAQKKKKTQKWELSLGCIIKIMRKQEIYKYQKHLKDEDELFYLQKILWKDKDKIVSLLEFCII